MASFVHPQDVPLKDLGGGTSRRVLAYSSDMMLAEVHFETGASGADHTHPHTQISYVLSGEFSYHIEGVAHLMKPGDSIVVESGRLHGCTCLSAGTLLDVFSPMRADFVR